jgi:peroxiredoxin
VVFVGINTKDSSPQQGLAFERRYDIPYPSLYDPSGRSLLAFTGTLNPSAIPSTVVLDKQGRVAASILDAVPSRQTLVDLVRDVQKQ